VIDRWPAIAAIALCLTALIIADQTPREQPPNYLAEQPALMPLGSSSDSLGSAWYCPAGLATLDGALDHVVIMTNPSDETAEGTLTVYPAVPDGFGASTPAEAIERPLEIPAGAQTRISLGALLPEDPVFINAVEIYMAALLEVATPGMIVEHSVVGPMGTDLGPCSSTAASSWHFASGTTQGDVRDLIALMNPFPGSASVDIYFPNDSGARRPTAYDGLVLPPRSVTMLDVRNHVPTWEQMATTVETRSGRVIVERLQVFDEDEGPKGATLTLGAPVPTTQWFFPAGRFAEGQAESYVIYNPNEDAAEVEMEVQFDNADLAIRQELTVRGGTRVVVLLDASDQHPISEAPGGIVRLTSQMESNPGQYWVSVRGFNDVGVVVERLTSRVDPAGQGMTAVMGAPLAGVGAHVAIPVNEIAGAAPQLVLLNPAGNTIARVTVSALAGGETTEILEVELGPRSRAVADLASTLPSGAVALTIDSTQAVMAELSLVGESGSIATMAVPVTDGAVAPSFSVTSGG